MYLKIPFWATELTNSLCQNAAKCLSRPRVTSPPPPPPLLQAPEEKHLGSIQQGAISVKGCTVEAIEPPQNGMWILRIYPGQDGDGGPAPALEVAADSRDEMLQWRDSLQQARRMVEDELEKISQESRIQNIATELSDLIIYCRSVPFDESKLTNLSVIMSDSIATKSRKYIYIQMTLQSYRNIHRVCMHCICSKGRLNCPRVCVSVEWSGVVCGVVPASCREHGWWEVLPHVLFHGDTS